MFSALALFLDILLSSYISRAPSCCTCPTAIRRRCSHRLETSSRRGHVDELPTEPFLLLHREHGTGYRRSWNCCDWRTRLVVIWKHFCFILFTAPGYGLTLWCAIGLLVGGAIQVPQWQLQSVSIHSLLNTRAVPKRRQHDVNVIRNCRCAANTINLSTIISQWQ